MCSALVCSVGFGIAAAGETVSTDDTAERTQAVRANDMRHIPLQGAANFRDLGGYVGAEGKRVRWGLLYRSDALDGLTAADIGLLTRLNIMRITDFRSRSEIQKRPDRFPPELEARYVHVPLDDPHAPARSAAAKQSDAANAEFIRALELSNEAEKLAIIERLIVEHYYPRFVRDARTAYSRWLHGLLDTPSGSAQVFHCTGGADRAGFAAAILLLSLGVSKEQVLEDYLLSNTYFFSPQGLALSMSKGLPPMPPGARLQARYLEASFKAMEDDFGSIDNYLREGLGIDDDMKRELRARFLE